mmetsp:Transcript_13233/g.21996  ORF Transcript_13233/g.21996 Transcript_13233/m.21996 type:complete len:87 (+) Transcript_13233:231-491(+)
MHGSQPPEDATTRVVEAAVAGSSEACRGAGTSCARDGARNVSNRARCHSASDRRDSKGGYYGVAELKNYHKTEGDKISRQRVEKVE